MTGILTRLAAAKGSLRIGSVSLPWSFVRYVCVGVINTAVGLSVIYLGIYALALDDVPANIGGYLVGTLCSFMLNRSWTFSSRGAPAAQLAKFLTVMLGAYLLQIASVMIMIKVLGYNRYLAHALGTVPYTLAGYLGSRYFAFRDAAAIPRPEKPGSP
ncbi:MAG TPA: GtrA family protein [Steroidobacteraceae bacterium]|jgi:putative flippase GtrA